jgi:hypothetical protein
MAIGRNGLRPFSAENHQNAIIKELLASYSTGNIIISDENKSKISAIELSRLNNHLEKFKHKMLENDFYNDIYQIDGIGGVFLKPYRNGENILVQNEQLIPYRKFLLSLDLDVMTNNNYICTIGDKSYISVNITFGIKLEGYLEEINYSIPFDKLSSTILSVEHPSLSEVILTNISLNYDQTLYLPYRMIVHSVIFSGR